MMEGGKTKRPRTGSEKQLLVANAKDEVTLAEGQKRRTTAETPTESVTSAAGGKAKGKEKANEGTLDFSGGIGRFKVLSATNSALASLDPAPRHDLLNAQHIPYTVMPPGPRIHNALLGLRLERYDGMSEHIYVNVAGVGARVGPPVEQDVLNAVVARFKSGHPDMVDDLTRVVQRPKLERDKRCTCASEWHKGMLGKNNSGAVLLVYFPDNSHIDSMERSLMEMTLPDTIAGERPMNVCFIDLGAHHTCPCMSEIMIAVRGKPKISLVLVAMCEPTQPKYLNVKKSDVTEFIIQVNETVAKLMAKTNLTTSTSELLMEKLKLFQDATKAAADVIRSQNIELESNKGAMFCLAMATNDVQALQKVLGMKSEFMRLLDTPGDDSGEGAAGSAGPETDSNAADPDEMAQLFLDLVKFMPERQYEQMRTRVLSAPLVTKAIDEQVAGKVKDIQSDATEEAIKARVAQALKEKEAQMEAEIEARVAQALKEKKAQMEAEIEARVAEAVKAKQLELVEKVSDIFCKNLVKSRDLFIDLARNDLKDQKLEEEIVKAWNEAVQEFQSTAKLEVPISTTTSMHNAQTGAAASAAAASAAAASAAAASADDAMDVAGGDGAFWVSGSIF
jgi:hypothetical protein